MTSLIIVFFSTCTKKQIVHNYVRFHISTLDRGQLLKKKKVNILTSGQGKVAFVNIIYNYIYAIAPFSNLD